MPIHPIDVLAVDRRIRMLELLELKPAIRESLSEFRRICSRASSRGISPSPPRRVPRGPCLPADAGCRIARVRGDRKILFFGNGGSAGDAQHLATEFTIRYG